MKDAATTWPASERETRALADLVAYEKNSRTHSEAQIAQIAASIREWGWTQPVLIDEDNTILAGHGRVAAAAELGIAEVPCIVARGWSVDQKRAYVIADNKLAENAGWDEAVLAEELAAIEGVTLDLIGFSDAELAELLAPGIAGQTDPDDVPPVAAEAISVAGDTWTLGRHRLRCGDSTNAADVAGLLDGVRPGLMVTDPPYGVNYDANWRNHTGDLGRSARAVGKVANDDRADWSEAWALFPGDVAYVWHAGTMSHVVAQSLISVGLEVRSQIIWSKNNIVISRGNYHPKHEPCWYAVRKGQAGNWCGDRKQSTVWEIDKPLKSETGHSTQKPVECMRRPIVNNTAPGQAVYEPFCGSGTTVIAGEMEGRPVYAMELDPLYCDVIVRRWQEFTGLEALDAEGRSFEARAA